MASSSIRQPEVRLGERRLAAGARARRRSVRGRRGSCSPEVLEPKTPEPDRDGQHDGAAAPTRRDRPRRTGARCARAAAPRCALAGPPAPRPRPRRSARARPRAAARRAGRRAPRIAATRASSAARRSGASDPSASAASSASSSLPASSPRRRLIGTALRKIPPSAGRGWSSSSQGRHLRRRYSACAFREVSRRCGSVIGPRRPSACCSRGRGTRTAAERGRRSG